MFQDIISNGTFFGVIDRFPVKLGTKISYNLLGYYVVKYKSGDSVPY